MSHFTTVKTQIVAREPLKQALTDLGLSYEEGSVEIRGYGGNRTRVDLRVPTHNPGYDLGFRKQGDAYELVADWWGIKDLKQDTFLQRLTQRYAYHVVKEQLQTQDFTVVEEEVQADNTIHIVVRRMA